MEFTFILFVLTVLCSADELSSFMNIFIDDDTDDDDDICMYLAAGDDGGSVPHFVMKPADVMVSEDTLVIMHCAANGRDRSDAAPTVVWLRDGSTIDLPYVQIYQFITLRFCTLTVVLLV